MWKSGFNPRHSKYVISCWLNAENQTEECENKDTEKDVPIYLGKAVQNSVLEDVTVQLMIELKDENAHMSSAKSFI